MTDITAKLAEALEDTMRLLQIARTACRRLGLRGKGSDARLSHEERMFALHFSEEGRDGPGELQVTGSGEVIRVMKCLQELESAYRSAQHTEAQAGGTELGREAFEAFHARRKSKGAAYREALFARRPDDTYTDDSVQRHWWTWQNARATQAAAPAAAQGDFWQWLAATYRHQAESDGLQFTRWNMQVAHEAGRQQGMEQAKAEMAKAEQAAPGCLRLVPVTPTEEMVQSVYANASVTGLDDAAIHEIWDAMVDAATPATERRPLTEAEERWIKTGRRWEEDSSLAKWFPITAEPLSDERVNEIVIQAAQQWANQVGPHPSKSVITARLIEAAHGITAGATEQAKEQRNG